MDIYALSQAGQMTFLESYVYYRNTLGMVNPEAFKLIGRALCYAGSPQWGLSILLEAQRHCAQDPEVYYHLAQGYYRLNQPKDAQLMLHQALMMQPAYIPAQDLLAEIKA
jgi:predicted Zn-dependent protease